MIRLVRIMVRYYQAVIIFLNLHLEQLYGIMAIVSSHFSYNYFILANIFLIVFMVYGICISMLLIRVVYCKILIIAVKLGF